MGLALRQGLTGHLRVAKNESLGLVYLLSQHQDWGGQ